MSQSKQLVLFLVDGMRPDGLTQADTPVMDRLLAAGAHTLTAQTVMPSMTLPCHTSLFLGVRPSRHGITTNIWTPQVRPVPGLFDVLQDAGLTTAFFYNWEELRDLGRPGALNASFMVKDTTGDGGADTAVAQLAARWLANNPFNFAFVYLGGTDIAGHAWGWMSQPYLQAIAHADRCIGMVLNALPPNCTVLVTSDHGGHERTHGTDAPEDMTIPWMIAGPGIRRGHAIQVPVSLLDTAPTLARVLNVPVHPHWEGRAVDEAFVD